MDAQDDEDVIYVETTSVCDGGNGALGHRVYLTIGDTGDARCPYCGRHFALVRLVAEERTTERERLRY